MEETSLADGDLTRLAQRFVAETCDCLTENWNVQREWWPLRPGSHSGPPVAGCGSSIDRRAETFGAAPEVLRAIRVVSLGLTRTDEHDIGLADTQFFVLVPCARWTDVPNPQVRHLVAQSPSAEAEDPMESWGPATPRPPRPAGRRPVLLHAAGCTSALAPACRPGTSPLELAHEVRPDKATARARGRTRCDPRPDRQAVPPRQPHRPRPHQSPPRQDPAQLPRAIPDRGGAEMPLQWH